MLEFRTHITRAMLRVEPDALFVFGDNMMRAGYGGQAKEMRGEPNAVGIPTKRRPNWDPDAFFTDDDFGLWYAEAWPDFKRLRDQASPFGRKGDGQKIVWPAAGIGSGRARLEENAPRIYLEIVSELSLLERISSDA